MRRGALIGLCLTLAAGSGFAQDVTFTVLPIVRERPPSEVPRLRLEEIAAVRSRAALNASLTRRNEGRYERRMILQKVLAPEPAAARATTLYPAYASGDNAVTARIMGLAGAFAGRKRSLYRQLEQAAEAAENATRAADKAYENWKAGRAGEEDMLAAEASREAAVRALIESSARIEHDLAMADELMAAAAATTVLPQDALAEGNGAQTRRTTTLIVGQ